MSHSHSRAVRPAQLLALLLAFLSVSSLMGVVTAGMLVPVAGPTALAAKSVPSVFNEQCAKMNMPYTGNVVGLNSTSNFKGEP